MNPSARFIRIVFTSSGSINPASIKQRNKHLKGRVKNLLMSQKCTFLESLKDFANGLRRFLYFRLMHIFLLKIPLAFVIYSMLCIASSTDKTDDNCNSNIFCAQQIHH